MLCKKCGAIMSAGTTYIQNKDGVCTARRFRECEKCYDKVYIKEPNYQECMSKIINKNRNKYYIN